MHFAPNNKKNEDAGGGIGTQSPSGGATASSSAKPRGPARTYSLDSNKSGSSASAALLKKTRSKPARTKSLDIDDDDDNKVRRSKPARTYSADSSMSGSSLASMRSSVRRGRRRDGSAKQRTSYFRLILPIMGLGAMFLSFFYQLLMSRSIDNIASIAKVDADNTSTRSQQRQPKDHQYNQRQNFSSTVSYGSMDIGTAANRTQQSHIEEEKPEGLELLTTSPAALPVDNQAENLKPPPFHLNDPTITASQNVERLWIEEKVEEKPPAKILLTDFGWNNPNKTLGLKYVRTIRQRELLQGVVDHPWFDPLGWDDIKSGRVKADPSIRYYVFLDVETCFELNYPIYSGRGLKDNGDKAGNRTVGNTKHAEECYRLTACPYVPKVLDSHLFSQEGVQSTLVIINCRGNGYPKKFRKKKAKGPSVAVAAVSTPEHKILPSIDQGLPPPAVKPLVLTPEQEKDIETCNEEKRPYLLTFSGAGRGEGARRAIVALSNNKDIITMKRSKFTGEELSYEELLGGSKFSAAPRGTNLFSYRFTEVLSAGSIPVVHADGWVWPFRKELVDWSECAVIMPESEANRTEEVLRAITPEQRCKMRKRCYELYKKYIKTGNGVIAGIIDGLELTLPALSDNDGSKDATPAPSLQLNDRTITLSPDIEHPWLVAPDGGDNKPPAKVLLTTYGWNHQNETVGLKFSRSARSLELLQGVVDHPWFESRWEDYVSGKADIDPNLHYYIFLDVETCFEANYPNYAGDQGFKLNADGTGGRVGLNKQKDQCYKITKCHYVQQALRTPLFTTKGLKAKLVLFDCKGDGPPRSFRSDMGYNTSSISMASVSSPQPKLIKAFDQGLPPPAVHKIALNSTQEKEIESCNETSRPYLLTFSGAGRGEGARRAIVDLNNDKDIFTVKRSKFKGNQEITYEDLLVKSKFSAAPRGTNLFSYRFTEVLSAGSIPVVHADGWVWPFRKELIDWGECAVIMPESEANRTEEVLRAITPEQRCKMRKRCYEIFKKYIETGTGVISGIVDGLELMK